MTRIGDPHLVTRLAGAVKGWLGKDGPDVSTRRACVIAHRGAARLAPENTLEAFARAVELGADGIETDISVTKDGVYVLWHDADPDGKVALARQSVVSDSDAYALRMADLGSPYRRPVDQLSLEELRAHYGYFRKRKGAPDEPVQIALLSDLFEWAKGETRLAHVYLDVKIECDAVAADRLLSLTAERGGGQREGLTWHFLSTHTEVLEPLAARVRREPLPPDVRLTGDFELPGVLENARRLGLKDVSMGCGARPWADFKRELQDVAVARDSGELDSLVVWTLNDGAQLETVLGLGVDGIMTDDPECLLTLERVQGLS